MPMLDFSNEKPEIDLIHFQYEQLLISLILEMRLKHLLLKRAYCYYEEEMQNLKYSEKV